MSRRFANFLSDETGAVTVDWIVLTAVLVGTGISVMMTVDGGVENAALDVTEQLNGQVIRSSFGGDSCQGGIAALQAQENQRVASNGGTAIDVESWMNTYHAGVPDTVIVQDYKRLSVDADNGGAWTRDTTIMTALECEMVLRGLD